MPWFWLLLAAAITLPFAVAAVTGAPWLPTMRREAEAALDLAQLKPGQTIIDLGSGDGRLLAAAARRGYRAIGYEINPFMYLVSLIVTRRYRRLVTIRLADFWHVPLPPADAIYVFLIQRLMPRLDAKLTRELTQPTLVISFVFAIPDRQPTVTTKNTYLYQYK
jgi:SAM-dependent methyltransferase